MNYDRMSQNPTTNCFFVSDLHGDVDRYGKLFRLIQEEAPAALFIGGDLMPSTLTALSALEFSHKDFINGFLVTKLSELKKEMGSRYPQVFVILGNDDARVEEAAVIDAAVLGIWNYCHNRCIQWNEFSVYGYSYVPPTPFRFKDWERYDVSRYVDPGCSAPSEGVRSFPVSDYELNYGTIAEDLEKLTNNDDLSRAIFLFHAPPYKSKLDWAALDGQKIDYVPLDVHVGSIAIQRFIQERQPLLTLHGHIHESTRLTGEWRDQSGKTESFNAAHDGPQLSLIRFDPNCLQNATRQLI